MDNITPVSVVDEMQDAYGAYSMAVLLGRAIPNLYDGLKPATRRVLVAMKWLGLKPDARFMKAARVEGETMGKLHPHGGAYGTMVTASQWWTNNHPLVDGHGNWGSPTDGPAAARYTEAKLTAYSFEALLQDSDTWTLKDNYDASLKEPIELNVRLPHILLNGGEGIGVGFATKIPTHNLRGVAKALRCAAENDKAGALKELVPDFPTGCDVVRDEGLNEYVTTGRGSIRIRAHVEQEEIAYGKRSKRDSFVFTNLPMHVNTEQVGDQIKDAVEKGKITTVADVRDETDRSGIRFVVVLKSSASTEQAKAELFKHTSLDIKYSGHNLVIDGTKPVLLSPYDILTRWLTWRDGRVVEAFKVELDSKRHRHEIVQGLLVALDMIDEVVDEIRRSKDKAEARARLMKRDFTEIQANAILDMRLSALTKLDDKTLRGEAKELTARIKELIKLNSNKKLRLSYVLDEIDELAKRHGNARRSKVIKPPVEMSVQVIKQGRKSVQVSGPKPRFVFVDEDKGILTQQRKLERSSWVVSADDKMLFVCDNGFFYKVGARHKGPLTDGPTKVLFKAKSSQLPDAPLIAVWKTDDGVFANAIPWETITKCTSRGKQWLPDGAELIHLGGSYELEMAGRKKNKLVTATTLKVRPAGGKGTKLSKLEEAAIM